MCIVGFMARGHLPESIQSHQTTRRSLRNLLTLGTTGSGRLTYSGQSDANRGLSAVDRSNARHVSRQLVLYIGVGRNEVLPPSQCIGRPLSTRTELSVVEGCKHPRPITPPPVPKESHQRFQERPWHDRLSNRVSFFYTNTHTTHTVIARNELHSTVKRMMHPAAFCSCPVVGMAFGRLSLFSSDCFVAFFLTLCQIWRTHTLYTPTIRRIATVEPCSEE